LGRQRPALDRYHATWLVFVKCYEAFGAILEAHKKRAHPTVAFRHFFQIAITITPSPERKTLASVCLSLLGATPLVVSVNVV